MCADHACPALDVVRRFWERLQARDWPAVRGVLGEGLVVELPATGERFTGSDAFLEFNSAYPEGWTIQVQRLVCGGPSAAPDGSAADLVVSEVQVPQEGAGVFAVAQFAWVRGARIVAAREFWVTCAGEEPPPWRAHLSERYDGRLSRS